MHLPGKSENAEKLKKKALGGKESRKFKRKRKRK